MKGRKKSVQYRKLRSIIYFSVFLILLGLGNILFGTSRARIYTELNKKLESIMNDNIENKQTVHLIDEKMNLRLKRSKAKLEFYRVVVLGGKYMLGISALLILYCLFNSRYFDKKMPLILLSATFIPSFLIIPSSSFLL